MHENILVPIDGSEHSFKALEFAADLAGRCGSTVHLLHVAQIHDVPPALKAWARTEYTTESALWVVETGAAENLLSSGRDRCLEHGVKNTHEIVEHGNVASKIIEVAKTAGVDLIVMGTRGFGDLAGLVLGSVAHKVTHAAPCTVVTVR